MEKLSYASESSTSPWTTYLRQIDRVAPYLGDLAYWVETLRHPKRALIVGQYSLRRGQRRHPRRPLLLVGR